MLKHVVGIGTRPHHVECPIVLADGVPSSLTSKVHVGVDEAGQGGHLCSVEDLGFGWDRHRVLLPHHTYQVPLHEDDTVLERLSPRPIDKTAT